MKLKISAMITPVIKPIITFITGIKRITIEIEIISIVAIGARNCVATSSTPNNQKMRPSVPYKIATFFPNDIALIFVIVTVDIFISNPEISIKITTLDKKIVIVTHLVVNTKLTINKSIKFL